MLEIKNLADVLEAMIGTIFMHQNDFNDVLKFLQNLNFPVEE